MTVLTDLALGIYNARWGIALFRQGCSQRQYSQVLWGIGFIAAAIAALLGGASHAVGEQSPAVRRKLWERDNLGHRVHERRHVCKYGSCKHVAAAKGKIASLARW